MLRGIWVLFFCIAANTSSFDRKIHSSMEHFYEEFYRETFFDDSIETTTIETTTIETPSGRALPKISSISNMFQNGFSKAVTAVKKIPIPTPPKLPAVSISKIPTPPKIIPPKMLTTPRISIPKLPTLPVVTTPKIPKIVIPEKVTLNATKLLEIVLVEVRKEIIASKYDSVEIPPSSFEQRDQTVRINNGTINGIANMRQVGSSLATESLTTSVISGAFGYSNLSAEASITIQAVNNDTTETGNVRADLENVTIPQIYKLTHLTRVFTLEEFKVIMGRAAVVPTGDGVSTKISGDSSMSNKILQQITSSFMDRINVAIKQIIQTALSNLKIDVFGK